MTSGKTSTRGNATNHICLSHHKRVLVAGGTENDMVTKKITINDM
eukprot:CAMPEP_0194694412 /NCGR_PEP_ID=MMETSP0295-20121207/21241_1 /TAXON_ID=39354 /ORGANISM="Heterosigma akashiwo, Strain CCMP2393" /LENGTH=44 /DNA_ID= /DNA_START= /DNA_END= /DNA_ORIENTATION=